MGLVDFKPTEIVVLRSFCEFISGSGYPSICIINKNYTNKKKYTNKWTATDCW